MTKELFVNGELVLPRKSTHGKRKYTNEEKVFSSRMEKREYDKNLNLFDLRNVIDIKGLLSDIRDNWNTYVSQVNQMIQRNPVKKLVVTGIFTIILGFSTISANAAWVQEYTYQVKKDDKMEDIAMEHGVTIQEILAANGISSIDDKKILLPKVQDHLVTASVLNVRSRPSTESSITAKLMKGDKVKVAFIENGWAGILIEGRLYYVSFEFLTKIEKAKSNPNNSLTEYVIKNGDTFIGIGKTIGVSASAIQELNTTVDPTKLKVGQKINIPATSTPTSTYESKEKTMYVTTSSLRVRESASTSSSILGKLHVNETVLVKSTKNGWAQINFNGKVAFVSETFLTDIKPVQVKNDINKNTNISLLEYVIQSGDTFTKIGRTIGVPASTIQELNPTVDPTNLKIGQKINIPSTTSTPTSTYESKEITMYVTASSLRVRKSASTSSSILGKLQVNETVQVKSIKNGWAQIDFNGKVAFVSETFLTDEKLVQVKNDFKNNTNISSLEYVIQSGDTFTKIGRTIGVSASVIQQLNPTIKPTKLMIGQTIYIPTAISTPISQINVVAQVAGVNPNGTFRFITSDKTNYAAQASGNLINELFQQQGKIVTLTLEGKRGQQLKLISIK